MPRVSPEVPRAAPSLALLDVQLEGKIKLSICENYLAWETWNFKPGSETTLIPHLSQQKAR